jgi:hypothetical protein
MTVTANTVIESKTAPSPSNEKVVELGDSDLDMVVGGINPQPLPPRGFS